MGPFLDIKYTEKVPATPEEVVLSLPCSFSGDTNPLALIVRSLLLPLDF
jgi:hypothetical protein